MYIMEQSNKKIRMDLSRETRGNATYKIWPSKTWNPPPSLRDHHLHQTSFPAGTEARKNGFVPLGRGREQETDKSLSIEAAVG